MRRFSYFLVGAAALAVLVGGGYYGVLYYAGSKLRTALDQSLAQLPAGWKAGYKDVRVTSLFPRTLVVKGLELHRTVNAPIDATIDEVTVLNPPWDAADPSAGARVADSISIKDAVLHTPGDELKIGTIRIAEPRRYAAAAPPPDAAFPPELANVVADLDQSGFDAVAIDDISIASGSNGPTGGIKQITVGSLDRGRLSGNIALSGFRMESAAPAKSVLSLGRFEIAHPNFQIVSDWQKAAADPSKLTADTALPIVDAVTLKGFAFDMGPSPAGLLTENAMKMDSAQITNLRLYPAAWLKNGGQAAFDQMVLAVEHPPESFDLGSLVPLLRFEAAALLSFGYGGTVDGIETNVTAPAGDTVEHVAYKLRHGETVNYDRGRLEKTVMEGLSSRIEPGVDASADKFEMSGLDLRDACQHLAAGAPLDPSLLDGVSLARFAYSGVSLRSPELKQPVTLDSFVLSNIAFAHGLPASADFAVTGFKISKAQMTDPDAIDGFTKIGLDTLTMSVGANYTWDAGKQMASIHDVSLKIDELGSLTLSLDFTGVDQPETLAETAKLRDATVHYADASLAGRMLKLGAERSGADPAAFRKQLAAMVQAQAKALLGTSPAAAAATGAVLAFLDDPRTLTVQVAPAQPLGFDTMTALQTQPPPKIFQALGVKVTANQ